jgi:O-antigen ligase
MTRLKIQHLQILFAAIIATTSISPPLANLFEILLVLGLFASKSAIENTALYVKTVDFKIHMAFMVLLLLGIAYPLADTQTYFASLLSWRKFLLLPIGYVLFMNDAAQKEKALQYIFCFLLTITVVAAVYKSQLLPFFNESVIHYQIGTTSSEGMFVAVALAIVLSSIVQHTHMLGLPKAAELIAALFLVGYIAFMTTGRSGYAAMLIIVLFLTFKHLKTYENKMGLKFWIGLLFVAALSVILLMSSQTSSSRIHQALNEFKQAETDANNHVVTSIGQRVNFWKNTIEMIPQYYMWGAGTGSFQAAYAKHVAHKTGLEAAVTQDPHNQYMKILIEQGVIGLMLFLGMISRSLVQFNNKDKHYLLGSAVICIWIFTSSFNAHFTTFMEGTFIWAWMGLMNRHSSPP